MTNQEWIDLLSVEFSVSRAKARDMLHTLMQMATAYHILHKEVNIMKLPDGAIKLRNICRKCRTSEICSESSAKRTMCKKFTHRQKYLYINMTDEQIESVYRGFGSAEEAIKELHNDVHEIASGEGYPDHMVFQAGIEDIERRIYKLYEHE